MSKLTLGALVYANDGDEFWVPVQYPSGIWRVQKLVAGENGRFLWSETRGLWMHVPSYRLAYTERYDAVQACRELINNAYNKLYWEKIRAELRHENMTKFIMKNYLSCKETR